MHAIVTQVCAILGLGTVTLLANAAYALHEIDHRYTISGYVRDDTGAAQSGTVVVVKDAAAGRTLGKATSGYTGFYSVRLHLHNSDLGKTLEVATGTRSQELKVQFDPDNIKDERTVEAHFGAPSPTGPTWKSPTFLTVAATVIACGMAYLITTRRRKRLPGVKKAEKRRKKTKTQA